MSLGGRARLPGEVPQSPDYKEKIETIKRQLWDLQQVEETREEAEYARLGKELEDMLTRFDKDRVALERENTELQSKFDGYSNLREQADALREEEAKLLRLKQDLDAAGRF